ncbi:MAG: hypothetical protein QOJ21_458 [Solirubrobacteraceae bacterium]|jgi:bacterioferritin-associated ferredoxin|nr:hypothetical protein [Solirubrobacteraceae bacterium]
MVPRPDRDRDQPSGIGPNAAPDNERESFLARYAGIEAGDECKRWAPVLSAMVDGEATSEQLMQLRPHLRNCAGCRATVRQLRGSNAPLVALFPIGGLRSAVARSVAPVTSSTGCGARCGATWARRRRAPLSACMP